MNVLKIGHVEFTGEMQCKRCGMVTVDQQSGVKRPSVFLDMYRRSKEVKGVNGVYFGRYMKLSIDGIFKISVGDQVSCS